MTYYPGFGVATLVNTGANQPAKDVLDPTGSGTTYVPPQSGFTAGGSGGGATNYVTNTFMQYVPPAPCQLAHAPVISTLKITRIPGEILPAGEAQTYVSASDWNALRAAAAKWHLDYPSAPLALFTLGNIGTTAAPRRLLYVVRPNTDFDPKLLKLPPLAPGTEDATLLEAGLRLFFPDYVLGKFGTFLRSGRQGSMTPDGPFPYWEPFVSQKMVDFVVDYLKSTPSAFSQPGKSQDSNPIEGALMKGIATGASTGNPIAAAGAAVGSLIISAFDSLFGSDPEPPAWLTKLLAVKGLREPDGIPSFQSSHPGLGGYAKYGQVCAIAVVHPTGSMTVIEGYRQVITRLTGGGKQLPWWLIVGLGVAGVYAAS